MSDLDRRLADAAEAARNDARYSCDQDFGVHDSLIARYGDLRYWQGRWEEHQNDDAHNPEDCSLERKIERAIAPKGATA